MQAVWKSAHTGYATSQTLMNANQNANQNANLNASAESRDRASRYLANMIETSLIERGRPLMRIVLSLIAICFTCLAWVQLDDPDALRWFATYALGGLMTAVSLLRNLPRNVVRLAAVSAMSIMFFYFYGFFKQVPLVAAQSWQSEVGLEAMGLLFGAFAMCAVVAQYSCRLKATLARQNRRAPAVFSAPHNI